MWCLVNPFPTIFLSWAGALAMGVAQVEIPSNPMVGPKKYETRKVGGAVDPGAKIEGIEQGGQGSRSQHYITHIILFEPRIWTSGDGRTVTATLIAFEDLHAEGLIGGPPPKMPASPERPTVVKDGKIRLLVNRKPMEMILTNLSVDDQEFIDRMRVAIATKAERAK
jgi:hypothetical protein